MVQSVQQDGLFEAAPRAVYWPTLASNTLGSPVAGTSSVAFAIRTKRAGAASLVEEIRQAVRSVSGSIPIAQERTVHDLYAGSLARTSFTLVLLGIAGAMALVLGVIGIYGAIAYVVSQRTREIGIRLALGERPERLQRMFLLHGLALSAVGAVVGLVGAVALGRSMSSLLFGISSLDPMAYIAALGLTLVGSGTRELPARAPRFDYRSARDAQGRIARYLAGDAPNILSTDAVIRRQVAGLNALLERQTQAIEAALPGARVVKLPRANHTCSCRTRRTYCARCAPFSAASASNLSIPTAPGRFATFALTRAIENIDLEYTPVICVADIDVAYECLVPGPFIPHAGRVVSKWDVSPIATVVVVRASKSHQRITRFLIIGMDFAI